MKPLKPSQLSKLAIVLLVAAASGCASLPPLDGRSDTTALRNTGDTKLGRAIAPLAARHGARPADQAAYLEPGTPVKAGLLPLAGGREALAARVVLADAAERAIDIQYYFWRSDRSGTFMFSAILRAADRGVRVRLLLDDNNTIGQDPLLWTLDRHPNIEVRLFNPFVQRSGRLVGFLTDFRRLNRRMHNKSFTVDNQATIIGGRNIGDEYFDATEDRAFADLDVLAVGAIVDQVSTDFDRYWHSESAFPVDRLLPPVSQDIMKGLLQDVVSAGVSDPRPGAGHGPDPTRGPAPGPRPAPRPGATDDAGRGFGDYAVYADAVMKTSFLRELFDGRLELEWAVTRMVSDDPGKVLGKAPAAAPLAERMEAMIGKPKQLLEMVSPYFVPLQEGFEYLQSLAQQGVEVRVLTNSLAATDVVAVHAGYARWRKPLLRAGVVLHEYKLAAQAPRSSPRRGGSSTSSLHAKSFSIDRSRVVIGSFNFDPRSLDLNTELGFVIDSPPLAIAVDDAYTRNVPSTAWQVVLDDRGELQWIGLVDGKVVRLDEEPDAGFWRRAGAAAIGLLPVDWLL